MIYYTDGFTVGSNPSNIGGGFTITDDRKNLIHHEQEFRRHFTNNDGELLGIEYAATQVCGQGDEIRTDSQIALRWVQVGGSKARPDLDPVCRCAKQAVWEKGLTVRWVRREQNLAGLWNEEH
jgi:ribonuclease HI